MNYLVMGNQSRLIKEFLLNNIKSDLVITLNYPDTNIKDIFMEASYGDLFGSEKYIIIYNTTFSKDDIKYYDDNYSKLGNSHIIFIANEKIKSPKNITIVDYTKLNYQDYKPMLIKYIKNNGYNASSDIIFYIMSSVLYNYDLMLNETDKIMLYYHHTTTDFKIGDVKKIVSKSLIDNSNKMINAILSHDYKKAYDIYEDLKVFKIDGAMLVTIIGKACSNVYYVNHLFKQHIDKATIIKKSGLRDYTVNEYLKIGYDYKEKDLLALIKRLALFDYDIKTGVLSGTHAMNLFLLDI